MKLHRFLIGLSLLLVVAPAGAAFAKDKDKDKDDDLTAKLKAQEMAINDAFKARASAKLNMYIDANAMMTDNTGMMTLPQMSDLMKDVTVNSYTIDNYKLMMIDKDAYVATYNWTCDATYKGQTYPQGPYYASTVWAKKGKEWKAVYHQETMAMQPGSPPPAAESH